MIYNYFAEADKNNKLLNTQKTYTVIGPEVSATSKCFYFIFFIELNNSKITICNIHSRIEIIEPHKEKQTSNCLQKCRMYV